MKSVVCKICDKTIKLKLIGEHSEYCIRI